MSDLTTIAIKKTRRPALELLAEQYRQERGARFISIGEAVELAALECLNRRGIDFLPAPEGATLVPVVYRQIIKE